MFLNSYDDIKNFVLAWHAGPSQTQQTPKPPAHAPPSTPPLEEHSDSVKQVPVRSSLASQGSFANLWGGGGNLRM